MCTIDWGFAAAWVGALATVGLLIFAAVGFWIWKKQFFKQRDYDLAIRILRSVLKAYGRIHLVRSPGGLITDGDVPVQASNLPNPETDREYRTMWARYRARIIDLQLCQDARSTDLNEAIVVWGKGNELLTDLANQLVEREAALNREVLNYLETLKPMPNADVDDPNLKVLFASDGVNVVDQFKVHYLEIVGRIRSCLGPKIRME